MKTGNLDKMYETGNKQIDILLREIIEKKKKVTYAEGKVELEDKEGNKEVLSLEEIAEMEFKPIEKSWWDKLKQIYPWKRTLAMFLIGAGIFSLGTTIYYSGKNGRTKTEKTIIYNTRSGFGIPWGLSILGDQDEVLPSDFKMSIVYADKANKANEPNPFFFSYTADGKNSLQLHRNVRKVLYLDDLLNSGKPIHIKCLSEPNPEDIYVEVCLAGKTKKYQVKHSDISKRNGFINWGESFSGKNHYFEFEFKPPEDMKPGIHELVVKAYDKKGLIGLTRVPVTKGIEGNSLYLTDIRIEPNLVQEEKKKEQEDNKPIHHEQKIQKLNLSFELLQHDKFDYQNDSDCKAELYLPALNHKILLEGELYSDRIADLEGTEETLKYKKQIKAHFHNIDLNLPDEAPEGVYDAIISVVSGNLKPNVFTRQISVYKNAVGVPIIFDLYSNEVKKIETQRPGVRNLEKILRWNKAEETVIVHEVPAGVEYEREFKLGGQKHMIRIPRKYDSEKGKGVRSVEIKIDNGEPAELDKRLCPIKINGRSYEASILGGRTKGLFDPNYLFTVQIKEK